MSIKITSPFSRNMTNAIFYGIQGPYVTVIDANKGPWGLPLPAVAALVARKAEYEPLYLKIQQLNVRTRADVAAHRDKRRVYEKELREFHNEWIANNNAIPAEQKMVLGGRERDLEPSPGAPITDVPVVGVKGLGGGDIATLCRVTEDRTLPSMHPCMSSAQVILLKG